VTREKARRADQVVVITGASSGIGLATALQLADEGASLVLASRGRAALARAAEQCRDRGAVALEVPTDVSEEAEVEALIERTVSEFGHVDAVVHSAGVLAYGRFEDVPPEVFERVVRTNVIGTANVARASLRQFTAQQHGNLVVIGSVIGKIATAMMSNYQTSKWATHGLVRALQVELRHTPGVDVTLVSPGGVDTPIYTQAGNYAGFEGRPPPPVYSPERVARRVLHGIDHPQREVGAGFANPLMVLGFRLLPGVYDALVTPLMRALAMSSRELDPSPGNTTRPLEDGEELRGQWKRPTVPEVVRLLLQG
jgi:short-subunit dehydrogenase